jgi:hypothetical protein
MDLTAAFEELLKRKGRREGYQYRHSISTQRIHPRAAGGYHALEGAYRNYGPNQGRASSAPSIPMQLDRAYSTHPVGHYQ